MKIANSLLAVQNFPLVRKQQAFCANLQPVEDTFERKNYVPYKNVVVKDLNNKPTKGIIKTQNTDDATYNNGKIFTMFIKGEEQGYALVYNGIGALELSELFTEENSKRKYKGIGSELLKCVVQESKNRGYKGKVGVIAVHSTPPFVFYYKNNFRTHNDKNNANAAINYASRENADVLYVMQDPTNLLEMFLDEKGAAALLEGKRLQSKVKTLSEKEIGPHALRAELIEDDRYYFQVIDKNAETKKQIYCAKIDPEQEPENMVYDIFNICNSEEIEEFTKNALDKAINEIT